jgi:ribulose-5-phosphate 4-epimerase/fuculose-1-phosphate aldolase
MRSRSGVSLRAEVVATAREMHARGLVAGTAGNVSAREGDLVHITPSAFPYQEMTEDDLVTLNAAGAIVAGGREPSTERRVHLAVYSARPDVGAIVHTHSGYATAWTFVGVPLASAELERTAGGAVRTARYAASGSEAIALAAVEAIDGRQAALLARHGVLGLAETPTVALDTCAAVERGARQAWIERGIDAHALMASSERPLVLGIGGGGDVVGALATAELCRLRYGARPVLGGVSWERRPIDPQPGPRAVEEIEDARAIAPAVLAAGPATRVRGSGVRFAESRLAELLGEETVLVAVGGGPAAVAEGLVTATRELGFDLAIFIDVGGDVIAHGDEPGLASPLCDAVMLAAAARLQRIGGPPVLAGIFGVGCDGELTPSEVFTRLDLVREAGGLATPPPARIEPEIAGRLEKAVAAVPTEASAMALRAYRGETGTFTIRKGRRTVQLTRQAEETWFFDPAFAIRSAAPLAASVLDAPDLEGANDALHALGVSTELDLERDAQHTSPGRGAQQ